MPETPFDPDLMIETGGDGRLEQGDPDALAARAAEHGHLVIHLHGGLVSREAGRAGIAALAPLYRAAGAFPVAFVWRTDPSIVCRNLREIQQEDLFRQLLRLVVQWAVGKLTGTLNSKGVGFDLPSDLVVRKALRDPDREAWADLHASPGELTAAELDQFEAAVKKDPELVAAATSVVKASGKGLGVGEPVATHLDPDVLRELGGGEGKGVLTMVAVARHAGAVLLRVVRRFAARTDHGVHATCVEEIAREFYLADAGAALWQMIKQESADSMMAAAGPPRGGRLFVDALARATADKPLRVSIVGHSAGSIYACWLLRALAEAGIVATDLLFLAAAVRYALFEETLVALGQRRPRRMHFLGLSEECESGYWEVPGLYPRSLLYMVSGAAERGEDGRTLADVPLVGMQRFHGSAAAQHPQAAAALADAAWIGRHPPKPGQERGEVHKHGGLVDPDEAPAAVAWILERLGAGVP